MATILKKVAGSRASNASPAQPVLPAATGGPQKVPLEKLPLNAGGQGCVVKFTNCRVFLHGKLTREDLWVRDGRIIDPVSRGVGMG